jgi:hypothetical protein
MFDLSNEEVMNVHVASDVVLRNSSEFAGKTGKKRKKCQLGILHFPTSVQAN